MPNSFHDTHTEIKRSSGLPCFNGSNGSFMAKVDKNHPATKACKGMQLQNGVNGISEAQNGHDHKIEVNNEYSNLLGEIIFTGQLACDKKNSKEGTEGPQVLATLTTKEFVWASKSLKLVDIVAVSHVNNTRRFSIHAFPLAKSRWRCGKRQRKRKDAHFLAPRTDQAAKWAAAFQSQKCFVNLSPQPLPASRRQGSIMDANDSPSDDETSGQPDRVMLVVLNPRSGRGRARKIYDCKVEPILKLAGIRLSVIETNGPHHAQKLAASVDLSTCANGIICVGGDGIVNEVLNGLLSRQDVESRGIAIGIIPAGSDNSLIWTVMGIHDPTSAAIAIVKGGLISTDIISVEWMKTGDFQMGHTITYYGFMSDVLELSEKYQQRFGPLRYFVAGAMKFLCLPGYECEVEYLPATNQGHQDKAHGKGMHNEVVYKDVTDIESGPRGANDTVLMVPCKMSGEHDNMDINNEPSEFVRAHDTWSKRSLTMRGPVQGGAEEVLAVNHSVAGPQAPSPRPRTRSKSRIERGWSGRSCTNGNGRGSWDYSMVEGPGEGLFFSGEELSKNGGLQDVCLDLKVHCGGDGIGGTQVASKYVGRIFNDDEKWAVKHGPFLGVMICNHKCKTVQCLKSQMLAPNAEHDDRTLDLLIVRDVGRLRLLKFLVLMQFGRHLSLPFVECMKVQSVKLKPGDKSHKGCGIDGELVSLNGPITVTLLDDQHQLIGHSSFQT